MIYINKITADTTVDFAAEELKKYLYMMMEDFTDVKISYAPEAKCGFRIGLMEDLGLDTSDVADKKLDDALYIDCETDGGVIAGSNPRSVLIAVYEYLRQNGCRWLFPGIDGEYIPIKNPSAVKYRHVATSRFRGPCIEGAINQRLLVDTIDFLPKVGMNLFAIQFFVPTPFFREYYNHKNSRIMRPEPVSNENIRQWTRAAESEIAKRGLQLHSVGHGWTAAPFGIDCSSAWDAVDESIVPEESKKYLALLGGRRGLHKSRVLLTQFCMSNQTARKKVVKYTTDYVKAHSNIDFLMFSLADGYNNHCECDECVKKTVSDWYVMLLNELDRALTEANLSTKVLFTSYTETGWAPISEKIENPSRFILEFAPITRSYTKSTTDNVATVRPFVRNKITLPDSLDEYLEHYKSWKNSFSGSAVAFEYHFWKHQVFDLSGTRLAERIFEDVDAYRAHGFDGLYACGSQRAYFPNGFAYYVFARKLLDASVSFDELKEDYYSHAYGDDWRKFYDYLCDIEDKISFSYLEGEESADVSISPFYNPSVAEKIKQLGDVLAVGGELIRDHYNSPYRLRTASVRVLEEHLGYVERLAPLLYHKALGDNESAEAMLDPLLEYISAREPFTLPYVDMNMTAGYVKEILYSKGIAAQNVLNV